MTTKEIEKSYSICGLVCALCSHKVNCAGCQAKEDDCDVKACCRAKGLDYCFLCDEWPCGKDMHKGMRIKAFNAVAKAKGLPTLSAYLHENRNCGICYHRADGLAGDYDRCQSEQEIIELLQNGRPDPYEKCPTYESTHFLLRLVSMNDAEDLLLCYHDPKAQPFFNSDKCTSDFLYDTLDEMNACIEGWLYAYKVRAFIRYAIIDKQTSKAIGTIEIFGGDRKGPRSDRGVLRIDIRSEYENKEALAELLTMTDLFFYDFNTEMFVTKAIPEAAARIDVLMSNGYVPYPAKYGHYYMKKSPED